MAWFSRKRASHSSGAVLRIENLDVYYGRAHALQGVSLTLEHGAVAVIGRNGMGKTTLCNAITGLLPASSTARGSVLLGGEEILGLAPHAITERGVGYVPQGRRVWQSLSVDEHLRLAAQGAARGAWTVDRVYRTFPRLAERRGNGGAELSGGEQQMLAIARALLFNPRLLVMDEPTEGLAPVIVQQVIEMLRTLAHDDKIAVLLIEQNLGVAIEVADTVAVMMNGRIALALPASELASDLELQQRLLGVRTVADEEVAQPLRAAPESEQTRVYTIKRAGDDDLPSAESAAPSERSTRGFTRWNSSDPYSPVVAQPTGTNPPSPASGGGAGVGAHSAASGAQSQASAPAELPSREARVLEFPVSATVDRAAYIAGTFDTKGRELFYLKSCLEKLGVRTVTVDLSTSGAASTANVHPREVARFHPQGERAVFTGDRGSAVTAMGLAFERFVQSRLLAGRRDLGGLISAGGSGGTALATQAMRGLPIGLPKVMVSSVASGDVRPYVGPSDICMMYSVTDVSGINRISEKVLANAAHALAGMITHAKSASSTSKSAIGLTMFGVTTSCVQAVTKQLQDEYDCLVFHATGTGGQSMEKLVDSGLLSGVIDVTTTEVCDEIVGGVLSAGPERLDAMVRTRVPYVASCGVLDMVNFWAMDTVPARFKDRNLYKHNPNVSLMRTTVEENKAIGAFIVAKLNRMEGPVRFVLPEGGVSALDAPGKVFWDPAADKALFATIEAGFKAGPNRKLIRTPLHINDPQFADLLVALYRDVAATPGTNALRARA